MKEQFTVEERVMIAHNTSNAELLDTLSRDSSQEVRLEVIKNLATSGKTIVNMLKEQLL